MAEETYEATANLTQATFLEFVQKYKDINSQIDEWTRARKALRKIMKGVGIDLKEFDNVMKDLAQASDILQERAATRARYLEWLGKPLGYQSTFGFDDRSETDDQAVAQHEVTEAYEAGQMGGRNGVDRSRNPWNPGTFLHQRYDEGWLAGQEELAAQILPSDSNGSKRRRSAL
jgi:hypothetical protein